ncbi:hypothetical protein TIFTF001_002775 [Ficus carica]|uniref:RNase H type-1 domain-containing protein n=1 Tax=Ficus carica TaxID=3494 RepID=A0AA87Z6D4_FICCA|nr:hypothetical protein TIFTF001_002775 [Ficus carica]
MVSIRSSRAITLRWRAGRMRQARTEMGLPVGGRNFGRAKFPTRSKFIFGMPATTLFQQGLIFIAVCSFYMGGFSTLAGALDISMGNSFSFEGKLTSPKEVVSHAGRILGDYEAAWRLDSVPSTTMPTPWKPPDLRQVKINIYASAHISRSFIGIGLLARDANGVVLGVMARRMARYSNWIVETDALNVVPTIKNLKLRSLEANVIQDVRDTLELSGGGSVCYGSHCGN